MGKVPKWTTGNNSRGGINRQVKKNGEISFLKIFFLAKSIIEAGGWAAAPIDDIPA
jgi:hypothetical protein